MKKSKLFRSFFSFIAVVIVLLTSVSTENASAQFGLFDTVWTRNNQEIYFTSSNDSLLFLYGSKDSSIYLVKSLNPLDTVWWSTTYPYTNSPRKFLNNDTEILFDTWDRVNKTHYYKIVNKETFETIDSVFYNWSSYPFSGCLIYRMGISEVDTSIYFAGYCNKSDIRASTYKVNYKTGQTKITSDSLPYFAMTISEDGQYVAGVYYKEWGGYYEILEVRKISDYSLVFREESKYSDWKPNFAPYRWVSDYQLIFSKDNKYLATFREGYVKVYNLISSELNFEKRSNYTNSTFSNSNVLLYLRSILHDNYSETYKICLYDCEDEHYEELDYPDTTNQLIFFPEDFVINDTYILGQHLYKYNKATNKSDGLGEVSLLSINFDLTSIENKIPESNGILYPNPANMNISIKMIDQIPNELKTILYNSNGKIVKEYSNIEFEKGGNESNYNVSDIPSGNYYLRISGKNYSQTYKVIINR